MVVVALHMNGEELKSSEVDAAAPESLDYPPVHRRHQSLGPQAHRSKTSGAPRLLAQHEHRIDQILRLRIDGMRIDIDAEVLEHIGVDARMWRTHLRVRTEAEFLG